MENPSPLPPSIPAPPPLPERVSAAPLVPMQPAIKPKFWNTGGFKTVVSIASIVITLAICAALYARANNFGQQVVEAHPVEYRIQFVHTPTYLDKPIVDALLTESYQYCQQDDANFQRACNTEDASILRDLAAVYMGHQEDTAGNPIKSQEVGFNGWIKSIRSVKREVAKDKSIQTIWIDAEWRMPAAWLYANETFYLIDDQGVRLPGEYKAEDRRGTKLMVITGMDLPNGQIPRPGEAWVDGAHAGDLSAGMKLAQLLAGQPFASQINGIDVSNINGRRDPLSPWIVLQTTFVTDQGTARLIYWGRPIGEEKYFDVKAAVKIKNLNDIYQHFSRIDAGRDYVDIHTELILLAKPGAAVASGQ